MWSLAPPVRVTVIPRTSPGSRSAVAEDGTVRTLEAEYVPAKGTLPDVTSCHALPVHENRDTAGLPPIDGGMGS